jgi:hypothetical protein
MEGFGALSTARCEKNPVPTSILRVYTRYTKAVGHWSTFDPGTVKTVQAVEFSLLKVRYEATNAYSSSFASQKSARWLNRIYSPKHSLQALKPT